MSDVVTAPRAPLLELLDRALLTPIRSYRRAYLPMMLVYFSYGALGLVAIAQSFWLKRDLTLSAAEIAALNVWLTLPWAVKMVFGEMVDTIPILGSQRRSYVLIGAGLIAASLLLLAAASARWITVMPPDQLYVVAALLSVVGLVIQDVVADAMSTEVVDRVNPDGTPRAEADIRHDLGMVQVLGRLALSFGIFATAGLSGWLAQHLPYYVVFLIGLVVPAITVAGALMIEREPTERRPTDWRLLGAGTAFGAVVALLALGSVPFNQEIVFVISLAVIVGMLLHVTADVHPGLRAAIFASAALIFLFRATPSIGEGYRWYSIDVLGFDEAFFGVLSQIGATLGLAGVWFLSHWVTSKPLTWTLFWLTVITTVLWLPTLLLIHGGHLWTQTHLGFGAREIAILDAAAASPFAQLGMIPMLALIARHAPEGHRAIWFALMASLMNLALVAGEMTSRVLNTVYVVGRGAYGELPALAWTVLAIGTVMPLLALAMLRRRVEEPVITARP